MEATQARNTALPALLEHVPLTMKASRASGGPLAEKPWAHTVPKWRRNMFRQFAQRRHREPWALRRIPSCPALLPPALPEVTVCLHTSTAAIAKALSSARYRPRRGGTEAKRLPVCVQNGQL